VSIIFFSAYLILLIDPQSLWSASFQLSFACVLTIELLGLPIITWRHKKKENKESYSRFQSFLNKIKKYFIDLLIISLCISVCVLPLTLYYFHYTNILNPIYNLVAIPIFSVIIGVSFFFSLLFFCMPVSVQYVSFMFIKAIISVLYKLLEPVQDWFIFEINYLPYESVVICYSILFMIALIPAFTKDR